jgi:ATP-dependent helicase/DNAse subunit B
MPLKLITGPVNSGKAAEVLAAVAAAAENGEDPILVVPTVADSDLLRRELAAGEISHAVRVTRFLGLWDLIARRAGFDPRPLDDFGCQRIARTVCDEALADGKLTILEESARTDGFASALARFADELGEVRASPAKFAEVIGAWGKTPSGSGGYGAELALLYAAYRGRLEQLGLRDPSGYVTELLDRLGSAPELWRKTPVFFYGFDDFELRQLDTIEALSGVADAPVVVSIPFEDRTAFESREQIIGQLRSLPGATEMLCEVSRDHYDSDSIDALFGLERGLFELEATAVDPGNGIECFKAGGPRAELELIAARIAALHKEGLAYEQIAVAVRDLDDAAPLIEEVFAAADVPIALRRRIPLGHTALARGVLALIACALCKHPEAEQSQPLIAKLIVWLRTPGVTPVQYRGNVDRLERRALRGELASLSAAEAAWAEISKMEQIFALEGLRAQFAIGPQEGYRAAAEQARRVLAAAAQVDGHGSAPVFSTEQRLDAAALGDLVAALDELDRHVGKDAALAPRGEQLLSELGQRELKTGESLISGAVSIATPLALRARRVEALFVARLQEGAFPRTASEDPFLDDWARRSVNAAARDAGLKPLWPADPVDRVAAERHLLHSLLSRATKLLVYSFHTRSDAGDPSNASLFLDDIDDLLDPKPARLTRALGEIGWPDEPKLRPSEYQLALASIRSGSAGDTAPYKLTNAAAIDAIGSREVWSATSIESYLRCPMSWLIDRFIRPEDLEPEADQLKFGGAMHTVLQQLFERLASESVVVSEESLEHVLEILDELIAQLELIYADPVKERIQRRRLRRSAAAYLQRAAEAGSAFVPSQFEFSFGFGDEPAADLGDGLLLTGKIDRIDVLDNDAIIIDYKTGAIKADQGQNNWAKKNLVQLGLYALAYQAAGGTERVVGALYQPVSKVDAKNFKPRGAIAKGSDDERTDIVGRSDRVEAERFPELVDEVRQVAVDALASIRDGQLEPPDPKKCAYGRDGGCAFPGICRRLC